MRFGHYWDERMNSNGRNRGIQAALTSAFFLGFAPIFGKQAINLGFTPLAVVALRTSIAVLLLIAIMAVFQRSFFYIYPVGLIGCLFAGFVNGIGSILYYSGLSRLDASVGQLIYSFYPLFLALWLLLDRQPVHRVTILRMILAVPGIYLLISSGQKPIDLLGALMMALSAVFYALHLLVNQRILYEVPAPTVTLYTLLSMSATVVIAYLIFDRNLPQVSVSYWPVIGLAGITFFSRITLFMGVKHLGSMQTALMGLSELLVTVFVAHLWLGDSLTPIQWLGAGLLAFSLILVGFDRITPEKRFSTGLLSWLNPPQINPSDVPWQT
jgi:drug/metabolite transporter (DMT)-like permease